MKYLANTAWLLVFVALTTASVAAADEVAASPSLATETPAIVMNFHDAPLAAVLDEMSSQLGLVILNPASVAGRLTVVSRSPLDADGAVDVLNAVLKANGYAAIRTGRNLRVVTLAEARKACIPVRSGAALADIGDSDMMITQVIPIRYAEAEKLEEDLADLIPVYAHLTSNAASNTLIFTATESDVRHLAEIVTALDVQMAASDAVRVFQLEYADADDTADLIEDVFDEDDSSSSGRVFFPPGMGRRGRQQPQAETSSGGTAVGQQRVVAAADEQTNSLVVSAPPEIMTVIAGVIEQLDSNPTAEESIFVYPLSNAQALELEPVLQDIFDEDNGSSDATAESSDFRGRPGGQGPGQGPGPGQASRASDSSSNSSLAGKVYVVAEESTNTLLVRTAPKYFDEVKAIIKELDRTTRQVLIKVLIAEITHDSDLDLGTEFSVLNLNISTGKGAIGTDFGVANLGDGLVGRYVGSNFEATIGALQQVGKLDILSRPYLLGSENKTASIVVGEEVPFLTDSRTTDAGQTVNTVEYKDIGIILEVTPYIGPDGMVIMDVSQEISSTTGRTVTVSEDFVAEVYAKRSAETRVAVANGRTVVIGGLMEDTLTKTESKVPLLGDIPLLGHAFKRTQTTKSKTELLIFLCPQTAMNADELQAISARTQQHAQMVSDAVEKGAFQASLKEVSEAAPSSFDEAEDDSDSLRQ